MVNLLRASCTCKKLVPFFFRLFVSDIIAEYPINVQRPNGNHVTDHIKSLFLLNVSRLIREGMLRGLDFPGNFSEFM